MELCELSAYRLSELIKKKEVSPKEILDSVLKRIKEKEAEINAYITVTEEIAKLQAEEAEKRQKKGELLSDIDGIPIAIKDNICTKGIRTTCASNILANYVPPYDATVVERILKAGAVIVGKTNMDEFAMGSSTETSAFGPTHNPVKKGFVPGGSSGGSAAAVASGEAIFALGSDTGGSIRQPASFCGVVGMKPTYGRVSRYGLIAYASSLDQIGPICRSVEDCAMLLNHICGHDPKDTTSAPVPNPDFKEALNQDIKGIKVGLPKEYFVEGLDSRIKEKLMQAVKVLQDAGAVVEEISLPHTKYAISTYYLIATAEASSNLARYDGVKYGMRQSSEADGIIQMYEKTRMLGFGREVKRRIMLGTYVLSAGYYEAYYLKALKVRTLIKEDFKRGFEKVDCILTPVSPILPFRIGERIDDPLKMYLVDVYTVSLNLSGLPGISIPCGYVDGLPVGIQLISKAFDEQTIIKVAHFYQRSRNRGTDGI